MPESGADNVRVRITLAFLISVFCRNMRPWFPRQCRFQRPSGAGKLSQQVICVQRDSFDLGHASNLVF